MKDTRISTGIAGLNEIMLGGFRPESSYLMVGGAGSGKTIISLQCCNESLKRKTTCLYLTFAEPEETIRKNAVSFGWNLEKLIFVDFTKGLDSEEITGEYSVFPPSEVEKETVWSQIYQKLDEHQPNFVVFDSATFLRYLSRDDYQYRKQVQRLINQLSVRKCISLLLFEPTELAKETSLALAVDGVINLRNDVTEQKVTEIRTIEINKMRGSAFYPGRHPFRISTNGITVWPHRLEKLKTIPFERKLLSAGIAELDLLLKGGIYSGTCTIFSGPSGVGKSSLGSQFLVTAAGNGMKGAIYTFEEGTASILSRSEAISIPIETHLEQKNILVREINPLEYYPDEFLEILRNDIEKNGVKIVMIDSLRGYNLAMEGFGNLVAHMQNLLNYCRSHKVSVILINEVEKVTGDVQITELGVSYLADNVILIRYAEYGGTIIKVISCLKMRLGNFEPELREYKITGNGLLVGEKLDYLRGLLTGIPVTETKQRMRE